MSKLSFFCSGRAWKSILNDLKCWYSSRGWNSWFYFYAVALLIRFAKYSLDFSIFSLSSRLPIAGLIYVRKSMILYVLFFSNSSSFWMHEACIEKRKPPGTFICPIFFIALHNPQINLLFKVVYTKWTFESFMKSIDFKRHSMMFLMIIFSFSLDS